MKNNLQDSEVADCDGPASGSVMTEQQMRDETVPTLSTPEELAEYVRGLVDRTHEYGTCVYAMSMAAVAAFKFVAGRLGVTGFQASCADLDVLRRTRGLEWGRVMNYETLLYPQYRGDFSGWDELLDEHRVELAERAAVLLAKKDGSAAEMVADHWRRLVANGPADPVVVASGTSTEVGHE